MRKRVPTLTRPNEFAGASGQPGDGRTAAAGAGLTGRRALLYAAALSTLACCGLLRPPTAVAACNPKTADVFFSVPGHNTADFEKPADGCAQPWLSYIERTAHIKIWVNYGGTYHNIQTTKCEEGFHTCNLASNWSTACEGGSCNNHKFHLQWEEGEAVEMFAILDR